MSQIDDLRAAGFSDADIGQHLQSGGFSPQEVQSALGSAVPRTSQTLGFEQGIGNFMANAAQPAIWAGKKLGFDMSGFEQGQQIIRNPEHAPNEQPGNIGKAAAAVPLLLGTAPMGPLMGGAAMGALSSEKPDIMGRAEDAALGGVLGKGTDMALGAAQRVISPALSPAVQKLLAAKIPLTAGQTLGGAAKDIEDKLSSWPIIGGLVSNAQQNSVKGFNKAVLNSALKPIGQTLPAGMDAGRDAVDHVAETIGKHYDSILPQMTGVLDHQFQSDIQAIGQNAVGMGAKQDVLNRFQTVLQAQIADRAQGGALTGDALKSAQQNLGTASRKLMTSRDADDQQLGSLLMDARSAFNDMLSRNNPALAPDLEAANNAYAQYVRIRRAASSVGSKDGVFSAPQFANAVKAMDGSAGKGAYARGNAFMQDLSDPANQVLPSGVPDSGTVGRGLTAALLTGGIPFAPKVALPALGAAALYTQPGQTAARAVLGGSRPAWAGAASNVVGHSRLPLSLLAASQAPLLMMPSK